MAVHRSLSSVDPALIARYPLLPEAAATVRADGPEIQDLMEGRAWASARSKGKQRAWAGLDGEPVPGPSGISEHEALVEVLGYIVARLLVSLVDDKLLTNRYATAEARRLGASLEEDTDKALLHVAQALEIRAQVREEGFSVPFPDYLRATRDLSALDWKLVNQTMDRGDVLLPRGRLNRLVQEAYKLRLLDELPLAVPPSVAEAMDSWARELTSQVQEIRSQQAELDMEGIEPDAFPPCIKSLISRIKSSENVSHEGRFATVAFMNTIGMGRDEIIEDLFSNVPDFARGITEYQVDHITGGKTKDEAYTPPGCSSLQTYGLCPMMSRAKEEWDDWCSHEKMNHPLTYYRWGLFVKQKREEEAGRSGSDGQGDGEDEEDGGSTEGAREDPEADPPAEAPSDPGADEKRA